MRVITRAILLCAVIFSWACSGPVTRHRPRAAVPGPRSSVEQPGPAPLSDPVMEVPSAPVARAPGGVVQLSEPYSTRTIPEGVACLIRLRQLGALFRSLEPMTNVNTPVEVTGPVGGIIYKPMWRGRLVCDCRLAVALHRAGLILRNLGVKEMHYSSAFRNSRLSSGRLSRHAMGLALDVHRVRTTGGELLRVKEHYRQGLADGCMGSSPLLNRMGCLLLEWGVFDRALSPDYNRAHYNHYHFAVLSLHRRRFAPRDGIKKPIED